MRTNFDIFTDLCFIKLESPKISTANVRSNDKHREVLNFERFQEKLGLFVQLVKSLQD